MKSKKSVLEIIEQVRDTVLKKQLIECSTTIIVSISGGQDSVFLLFCLSFLQFQINFTFKMVWCNHFWQIDSFYTTLHLTMCAINFASPLITFLPLHVFDVDLMFLQAQKVVRPYTFTGSYLSCIFLPVPHTNLTAYGALRAKDRFVIAMSLLAPTCPTHLWCEGTQHDKKMHGSHRLPRRGTCVRCDEARKCVVQHSNHKPKVCVGAPSHRKCVRHGLHDILRQIFQTKFVPVRRQLLIRQVKTFLSIYQITELNLFLTFAKTKVNFLDLCCVRAPSCPVVAVHLLVPKGQSKKGHVCVAVRAPSGQHTNLRFVRGKKGRAQQTEALFTPISSQTGPHSIRSCALRAKERLGLCGARAQSSFACIDKKNITMSSETKARHWRHITTQISSTFYTSEKAIYGHTLSDRVETIIFNLIRGSGNTGVKSLSWKRKLSTFSYNKFYLSLQQVVKNTHLLLEL